jgi:integrase
MKSSKHAQQLPSGNWRVVIRRTGLGYHSAVLPTKEGALRWRLEKLAALYKSKGATSDAPALKKIAADYFDSVTYRGKAKGTQVREKVAATPLLHIGGRKDGRLRQWAEHPIDTIDGRDIQDYIDARSVETCKRDPKKTISADSIRLEIRLLSCLFQHAVQGRYRTGNPALARDSGLRLPASNIRDLRISPTDELLLSDRAREKVYRSKRVNPAIFPWLELVRATGCRPGEAAKIELAWIKLGARHIDIPRRGTKKRNPRRVLLPEDLVKKLEPQLARAIAAESNYLFFSISRKTGKPIPFQYNTAWRQVREAAGVQAEAHGMRRELISRLFESSGLTDGQIALLVGDVNVMSLEPYKHLRATELRAQYDAWQVAQELQRDQTERAQYIQLLAACGRSEETLSQETRALLDQLPSTKIVDPVAAREAQEQEIRQMREQYRQHQRLKRTG